MFCIAVTKKTKPTKAGWIWSNVITLGKQKRVTTAEIMGVTITSIAILTTRVAKK